MNQIVTKGIVLRRVDFGEADRIITILTPDLGKVVVLARGVRKSNSKLAGSIELFGSSQITYLPGKGSVGTLISARLLKDYGNIVKDLNRTQLAFNLLKLINKSIEDASGGEFFELLEQTYESINNLDIELGIVRAWFGLRFLELMGNDPDTELERLRNSNSENFNFDFDKMIFIESESGNYSHQHIKLFMLNFNYLPIQLMKIKDITELNQKVESLVEALVISSGFDKY